MVDTLARSDQLIDANIRRLSKRGRFWLLTVASVDVLPVHGANDHRDHACRPGRKTGRRFCGQRHDQRSGRRRRYRGRRVDRRRTLQQAPRTTTRRLPRAGSWTCARFARPCARQSRPDGCAGRATGRVRKDRLSRLDGPVSACTGHRADRRGHLRRDLVTGPRRATVTGGAPAAPAGRLNS